MKTTSAAAAALATWYSKDPVSVERSFQHLTPITLERLDKGIQQFVVELDESSLWAPYNRTATYRVLAQAAIRHIAHKVLDKYSSIAPPDQVEDALKYYNLPVALQNELWNKYGGTCPPTTWWEALERLRESSRQDLAELWRVILDHPMTAYVPMQCQSCGHVVPDITSQEEDKDIGLSEVDPLEGEELLQLRGGWFRGRPRAAKMLQLDCPKCRLISRWYRSSHPQILLNPNKWGRLCGEQEDLRLALANYLGIQVRLCIPLDWDHIWSEYNFFSEGATDTDTDTYWQVHDDSARNFAVRLDEGIGAWTGILGIHPDPNLCQDLTSTYLRCSAATDTVQDASLQHNNPFSGRADPCHCAEMTRFRQIVESAQADESGNVTQAKTVVGNLLRRAAMTSDDITAALRCASIDYRRNIGWWEVGSSGTIGTIDLNQEG